jgi:glycerol uptake facilitator protein
MTPFLGELVGTAVLLLLGDGVVANVVLGQTKGQNSGWIVITFGWGMAVFVAVFIVAAASGAHINPAVTLGLAIAGKFAWAQVPIYLAGQMLGAALGAFLMWLHYRPHFAVTNDPNAKLAVFCTAPAIRDTPSNFVSEVIGTFVLVFAVLYLAAPEVGLGALDALPVGLLVLVIGLSLGGTTGYAINPARDLSPRLMHALLPIPKKRDSDWSYAWVPVVGPVVGGALAAGVYLLLGDPNVTLDLASLLP